MVYEVKTMEEPLNTYVHEPVPAVPQFLVSNLLTGNIPENKITFAFAECYSELLQSLSFSRGLFKPFLEDETHCLFLLFFKSKTNCNFVSFFGKSYTSNYKVFVSTKSSDLLFI